MTTTHKTLKSNLIDKCQKFKNYLFLYTLGIKYDMRCMLINKIEDLLRFNKSIKDI